MPSTIIKDLKEELLVLDLAISECSDDCGVVKLWMKHRLSALVEQKESFLNCINYFEINNIGVEAGKQSI